MGVTLERCEGDAFVLRAGPDHHRFGDPYVIAGTVDVVGDIATVKGFVSRGFALFEWSLFRNLLRPRGARWLRIERREGDRVTIREWRL